jgi:hypothetical protein
LRGDTIGPNWVPFAAMEDRVAKYLFTATCSLTVGASGSVNLATLPLLTAKDLDEAARRTTDYRAPDAKAK